MTKKTLCCIASCLLISAVLGSCSTGSEPSAAMLGMETGLGEISADRLLYFGEGEDFKDKAGGDYDQKGGASRGKCLGMTWGANATDFAAYDIAVKETSEDTLLVIRAACEGKLPQFYDVAIDGVTVRTLTVNPTGGYGYTEKEWKCFSVPLGRVTQGPHTMTLKSIKNDQIVNIDCFALGKAR